MLKDHANFVVVDVSFFGLFYVFIFIFNFVFRRLILIILMPISGYDTVDTTSLIFGEIVLIVAFSFDILSANSVIKCNNSKIPKKTQTRRQHHQHHVNEDRRHKNQDSRQETGWSRCSRNLLQ